MKYTVSGGTGFIGSGLVKGLLNAGAQVRTLDNDSRGGREKLGPYVDRVEIITGDIAIVCCEESHFRNGLRCHLAYINGMEFFYEKPELVLEVAVRGMINIFDACMAEGVKNLAWPPVLKFIRPLLLSLPMKQRPLRCPMF